MANIDILTLEETSISRDLKNKYILIYSQPKVGKTSFAAEFPKNLILAFEKGYNAIAGIKVVDIPTWRDFKTVLKQLKNEKAREMYNSITFDTIGIAWNLCEKYICAREQVDEIGEIPYGKGYKLCTAEFEETLRDITLLGYGIVFISHSEEKPVSMGSDETIVRPAIPKRAYEIVNRIVDIIGYIGVDFNESGVATRTLYTRSTPGLVAGSRFKYMPERIPFGYDELVQALSNAIEEEGKHGAKLSNERAAQYVVDSLSQTSFTEVMDKAKSLWLALADNEELLNEARNIIENRFGRQIKLSQATEKQKELVELVVSDLEELLGRT